MIKIIILLTLGLGYIGFFIKSIWEFIFDVNKGNKGHSGVRGWVGIPIKGKNKCLKCNGTGQINGNYCKLCNGNGKIKKDK